MAWIASIERKEGKFRMHPTQVIAYAKILKTDDRGAVVQIDTYGSSEREMPNKLSQTIQFGPETAKQLYDLLRATYNFSK